jgi:1,6-anhydro-N-acetylmuramate kinase
LAAATMASPRWRRVSSRGAPLVPAAHAASAKAKRKAPKRVSKAFVRVINPTYTPGRV